MATRLTLVSSLDADACRQAILAIDRANLNKKLLNTLEAMPNVKFFFNHKLTGADFHKCQAWFEAKAQPGSQDDHGRSPEIQVSFDLMIGADGAHSAVRYHMMKFTRMDYSQEYIDTLWCEFRINPREAQPGNPASKFAISPNHLHIWPGKEFMFIAIPSEVSLPLVNFSLCVLRGRGAFVNIETRTDPLPALCSCLWRTTLHWRATIHLFPPSSTSTSLV